MNLEREDIKLIPRALVGLTLAAYNVYLKPMYQEKKKLARAARIEAIKSYKEALEMEEKLTKGG